jgi:hypothetical protein
MVQKFNSLWRGKIYAPLLQQPFSAAAVSSLPKGIKLLDRSADFMAKLAAAFEQCQPDSDCSPAPDVAAQQTFLQELQQHNLAQLAAELLSWLQAWPDLADALLSTRFASSDVQVSVDLLWKEGTQMLTLLLEVVHKQAAAAADIGPMCGMPNPWLELLEQLISACCTSGAPGLLESAGIMHA